ncbi:anti-sigma factor family protein [Pseudotabrizicola formosa]|uniref:anti-sigma factor family protein n=1 Tax=Pseudotabrizicola formosa TaxID=2030009 RepID=UPI000CCFF1D2|nr:hypothetical protein [Pseudotabrizicola formosa]
MIRTDEVSTEMLMALADGELPEPLARDLRARVAADPGLAARFAVFSETRALMQAAFPPEPVPQHLIAAVMQGGGVPTSATHAADAGVAGETGAAVLPFAQRIQRAANSWGLALAASLVLAVGAAGFVVGRSAAPPTLAEANGPEAAALALAAVPTGGEVTLTDGTQARALASYETDLGLCRLISTQTSRAIACRAEAGWDIALAVSARGGEAYQPASEIGTALIDRFLDDVAASPALDPAAEAQALRR